MSNQEIRFEPDELQKEFLEEIHFMMESIEESFLKLDAPDNRQEELTNIFRVIHSVKGAAGAVGFDDLSAFAHIVEDLLQLLRVDPDLVSREIVTLLLKSVDLIKNRTQELSKGVKLIWDVSETAEALKRICVSGMTKFSKDEAVNEAAARQAEADAIELAALEASFEASFATPAAMPEVSAATAEPVDAATADLAPAPAASASAPAKTNAAVSAVPTKRAEPAHDSGASSGSGAGGGNDDQGKLLKVDSARVTSVIELVGELVTIKSQILRDPALKGSATMRAACDLLDKTVRELHDQALALRMTSLKTTFKKVQRIARDLSVKLEKPIALAIDGDDTEMDRNLTEMITDPLVHLIRNAIDHGIENREKRLASGKHEVGMISISASQRSGRIVIEIRDDGGGINRTRVIDKAKQNGIIAADRPDADISDKEAFGLLFAPGFSTAEKVTDVSGRGVGLDVVKTNIQQRMKGTIEIESQLGKGSLFRLSLPLTTSITEGILADAGGRKFILPLDRMRELIRSSDMVPLKFASGSRLVRVREQMIPYLSLKEVLCGMPRPEGDQLEGTIIVMETATTLVAVGVDTVISQTQVVLKPLDRSFRNQPEISGATILGDGSVALVLDIDGLLKILMQPGAKADFVNPQAGSRSSSPRTI